MEWDMTNVVIPNHKELLAKLAACRLEKDIALLQAEKWAAENPKEKLEAEANDKRVALEARRVAMEEKDKVDQKALDARRVAMEEKDKVDQKALEARRVAMEEDDREKTRAGNERIRREFNDSMKELHANLNNRPYSMTIAKELLMRDELEVVGTRARPAFLAEELKQAVVGLLDAETEPLEKQRMIDIAGQAFDLVAEDIHVFGATDSIVHSTVSMSDAIVLVAEYVAPACGVDRDVMTKAQDKVFRHHGIRHEVDLTLNAEAAAMSILRRQKETEERVTKVEKRVDVVEARVDNLEFAALNMARQLARLIKDTPGAIRPDLAGALLCRLSDWRRQITHGGAVLPDMINRHGQERKLVRAGAVRKSQPSLSKVWQERSGGAATMPCFSCARMIHQKNANVGHVVANMKNTKGSHGGHNLEIACLECNAEMGSMDADFWVDSRSGSEEVASCT
jgi:hypothetical protein